jgi:flagellin-like protein
MKKGISPLVASVLLIAATMSIAGILAYWASSFVSKQTDTFENQSITGECNYAGLKIYSCNYNASTRKLTMILENTRDVTLKELSIFIFYPNSTVSSPISLNDTLTANQFKSFAIDNIDDFSTLTVKTQCSEISKSSSCSRG